LSFRWWLDGAVGSEAVLDHVFDRPGFHRLGLTVDNGSLAGLAWRDLVVVQPVARELGTEGQAKDWRFELENDNGSGRVVREDDPHGIFGNQCLRFTPNPYPGAYATAIFPKTRDANWNFTGRKHVRFWIRGAEPKPARVS